jgi:HAE1 family hydrophobic/amphiphilic exporter-1
MAEVGFSQAIFTWGQVGAAIRAAKAGLMTAEDQLRLYRQEAILNVTKTFYNVLLARELHAISLQNLEQKVRHLDESERRFAVGVATDYDVLAARVAADNARPEVIRTENLVRQALDRLRYHLAMEDELDAAGTLESDFEVPPSFDEAFASAREHRPELADLRHRLVAAQELVTVANAEDKPRLDLRGGYGWKDLEVDGEQSDGPAWSIGLHFSFPIFDGLRTRGKVAQAESEVRSRIIDEAQLLDNIAMECRDGVNGLKEAEEIVRALAGTVGLAERLLEMAEKGFEYGVKIRLEVDDAELNLKQARGSLARARRDYLVARSSLARVMGTLGE